MAKPKLPKLTPTDYAVMFGGPLLFLIIAVWGIRSLAGPAPRIDPVEVIRRGEITAGMKLDDAIERLGPPAAVSEGGDGSQTLTFRRTAWDQDRKDFVQNEGVVEIDAAGRVLSAKVDVLQPPPASNAAP